MITEFTQAVCEKIGYYVYFLRDPRDKKIFYIGKGKGNRVFNHVNRTLDDPVLSDKYSLIRTIEESGKELNILFYAMA